MQIAIIGAGAIAEYVTQALALHSDLYLAGRVTRTPQDGTVTRVADLPSVDLLVDCAGHAGLAAHGALALASGIDVLTLSLGALADEALAADLMQATRRGGAVLHLASGAIGALDALRAAREGGLERGRYTGRKPPEGWRGSPAEAVLDLDALQVATAHFTGTARDAALAAMSALAAIWQAHSPIRFA